VKTVYLDNAATTPIDPAVRSAMRPWLEEEFGNPSSRHALGVRARAALDDARGALGALVGAVPERVVFTGSGTEANNLAVAGLARARRGRGRHVLIGPTEHSCVREAALALRDEGFEVEVARVDGRGALDLDDLAARLRPETVVVAQMLVNNEFGTIYPLRRVAARVRERAPQAALHVDAVQAFGKLSVDLEELDADSVAISAHKLHGPKGVGALVLRRGADPEPLIRGGGQEGGLRAGTQNVAGIVGLARAATLADERREATLAHLTALRGVLRAELAAVGGARLLEPGGPDGVLPSIASIALVGPPAEVYLHHLEQRGVLASVGSACQSNKRAPSPALAALGLSDDEVRRVLRLSFSAHTGAEDVRRAARELGSLLGELEVA